MHLYKICVKKEGCKPDYENQRHYKRLSKREMHVFHTVVQMVFEILMRFLKAARGILL